MKVKEVFQGKVVWEGGVSVFELVAHPTARRAYVWSYLTDEQRRRLVAALHVDPINTPHRAVQAYLVNEARKLNASS